MAKLTDLVATEERLNEILAGCEECLAFYREHPSGNCEALWASEAAGIKNARANMIRVDEDIILGYADYVRQVRNDRDRELSYWETGAPISLTDFARNREERGR